MECTTSPDTEDGGKSAKRSSVVPPYWQRHEPNESRLSCHSVENGSRPTPIRLEDHTDEGSESLNALWAKHVTIDDYVIVGSSTAPAFGAYVVFNITVETLDGGPMKIIKRYSEFHDLFEKLVKSFPPAAASLPPLPPKSVVSRFRPRFLEKRRAGLAHFLNCILLNPEFAASPIVLEFLFS
ncbi:Phox-like protein [Massarina eburnea CBS 473.64]|uniref:Endosomal/vacuolar adapter protein YPT35 n=1 Tax=Massarina eburnea CBS 473.64 TaxID=1395130 RepID=A0A6A6RIJ2_9PLEO|nr:Phox-like protein [Massarina eburnea CBS 473.64]